MDGYLAKPIRAEELYAAIDAAMGPARPAPSLSEPAKEPSVSGVVDWAAALAAVGGNSRNLQAVVAAALEELPAVTLELRRAVAEGDVARVRRAAHTLKGAIRYFGASEAYDLAFALETLGREGRLEGAETLLADLAPRVDAVVAALRRGNE